MKKIICNIVFFVGFVMFVVGLALLNSKFGTMAWVCGILASLGVFTYTHASYIKRQ